MRTVARSAGTAKRRAQLREREEPPANADGSCGQCS
ncbi:hypothetical protein J2S68_002672 [Glycomyces algeriensis]|nr:hypothetical protein [Glycomyces algeriensis]